MSLARRSALFGAYCAAVALINAAVIARLVEYSRANATASHVILIPFVVAALVFQNRTSIFRRVSWSGASGGIAVVIGALMAGVAVFRPSPFGEDLLALQVGSIVVLWVGGFLLCFGARSAWEALFPLCFLAFTVPMPKALLDAATAFLKEGSTEVVAGLFALTGTPFYREGNVFSIPNFVIVIADECSGIRSSIALLLTSLLAGDAFLKNVWGKTVLVLSAFPLALIKNGIRIVGLSLLAMHVDPSFLDGQLHHEGGIVFFLISLVFLGFVLYLVRRFEMVAWAKTQPVVH
jgi:exosortase